ERQADLVGEMDEHRAADILEQMEPDAAADILADLSEEKQGSLLAQMQPEEAEDVQELLGYDEDSAGGLMTTYYLSVPANLTTAEAVRRLRPDLEDLESIPDVYVTAASTNPVTVLGEQGDTEQGLENEAHNPLLVGRVSLRHLLLGGPHQPLAEY